MTKQEKVRKLFEVNVMREQIRQMSDLVVEQMMQMLMNDHDLKEFSSEIAEGTERALVQTNRILEMIQDRYIQYAEELHCEFFPKKRSIS